MAERFDFASIFSEEMWTIVLPNAEAIQDRYLNLAKAEIEKTSFPNLEFGIDEYVTGGIFFSKEATKMLRINARKSQFKKFEIYFRAQVFGNVAVLTRMDCMDRGFFDKILLTTGPALNAEVRSKCKNMAQYEEYVALMQLGSLIYYNIVSQLDPQYKERKSLAAKA